MGENNLKKKLKKFKRFCREENARENCFFLSAFIFLARESNFDCQLLEIRQFLNFAMS